MVMSPAVAAIALICLIFWSDAFAQAKTYWYCQFTPFGQHNVMYLSDVFGPTKNAMSMGGSTQQKILAAFDDYWPVNIPKSAARDAHILTAPASPTTTRSRMRMMAKNNGQVIETGWRYQGPP
jgi:hypothetical protein